MSTDTESSIASSVRVPRGQDPPWSAEAFTAPSDVNNQLFQPTNLSDSSMQPQNSLEAQVLEIAAREGVTLPRTKPLALTSITIATRRRSTSPSPSTSPAPPVSPAPEPLHLTELSTGAVEQPQTNRLLTQDEGDKTTREPASVFEPSSSLCTRGNRKRLDAVGGQFEEPHLPSQGLNREHVDVDELTIQDGSVSGAHGADQTTVSPTSESPTRTGHISHIHLTLSPKTTDHSLATVLHSSHADVVTGLPHGDFVPLRHSSSAISSPDEGVGLSSPPEWYETREPSRQRGHERADTSALFKAGALHGRIASTSKQSFTPRHRPEDSQRPLTTESPGRPVMKRTCV